MADHYKIKEGMAKYFVFIKNKLKGMIINKNTCQTARVSLLVSGQWSDSFQSWFSEYQSIRRHVAFVSKSSLCPSKKSSESLHIADISNFE